MRPAPFPNDNEMDDPYDAMVADPLADSTLDLWNDTARKNREIFTEVFRPVPSNLVQNWNAYDVRLGYILRATRLPTQSRITSLKSKLAMSLRG
jgi:phospholipase D1/2